MRARAIAVSLLIALLLRLVPLPTDAGAAGSEVEANDWKLEVTAARFVDSTIQSKSRTFDMSDATTCARSCIDHHFLVIEAAITNLAGYTRRLQDSLTNFRVPFAGGWGDSLSPEQEMSEVLSQDKNSRNFLVEGAEPDTTYILVLVFTLYYFNEDDAVTLEIDSLDDGEVADTLRLDLPFVVAEEGSLPVSSGVGVTENGIVLRLVSAEIRDEVVTAEGVYTPRPSRSALVVTISASNPTDRRTDVDFLDLCPQGGDGCQNDVNEVSKALTAQIATVSLPPAGIVWLEPGQSTTMVQVYEISGEVGVYFLRSSFDEESFSLRIG